MLEILLYVISAYIIVNYLVLLFSSMFYRAPAGNPHGGKITAIIPAKDDHAVLDQTLRRLKSSCGGMEIIVVDSSRDNKTRRIARKYRCKVISDPGKGKSYALNLAVEKAAGEFLYFIDADCLVTKTTIKELLSSIGNSDAAVGMAIAQGKSPVSILGSLCVLFLNAANFWLSAVAGTAFVIGRNFIIRKSALRRLGNFDNVLTEDINLSCKLYKSGRKVVFVPHAVCFERSPERLEHFFRQQERWGAGALHEIGKASSEYPLLAATLFLVALFYALGPLFLLLSFWQPVFLAAALSSALALLYFSVKYVPVKDLPKVPFALLFIALIYVIMTINLAAKKILGVRVGWYKTPKM